MKLVTSKRFWKEMVGAVLQGYILGSQIEAGHHNDLYRGVVLFYKTDKVDTESVGKPVVE